MSGTERKFSTGAEQKGPHLSFFRMLSLGAAEVEPCDARRAARFACSCASRSSVTDGDDFPAPGIQPFVLLKGPFVQRRFVHFEGKRLTMKCGRRGIDPS